MSQINHPLTNNALIYLHIFRNDLSCDIAEGMTVVFFHSAKLCTFTVFLNRLILSFRNSIFEKKFSKHIIMLYILLTLHALYILSTLHWTIIGSYNSELKNCDDY